MDDLYHHHPYLQAIALEDARFVQEKDTSYGASWKKRGGVGVFMMLARKWDRLETMLSRGRTAADPWDMFGAIRSDNCTVDNRSVQGRDGTVLAEVRDLRRYLLLVEAEMMAQGAVDPPQTKLGIPPSVLDANAISADKIKPENITPLGTSVWVPGTPADGGHHARMIQDDPMSPLRPDVCWTCVEGTWLVDRRKNPPEVWEHLPRVATELNQVEFDQSPTEYRGLYEHRDLKWRMRREYMDHWGLLP